MATKSLPLLPLKKWKSIIEINEIINKIKTRTLNFKLINKLETKSEPKI